MKRSFSLLIAIYLVFSATSQDSFAAKQSVSTVDTVNQSVDPQSPCALYCYYIGSCPNVMGPLRSPGFLAKCPADSPHNLDWLEAFIQLAEQCSPSAVQTITVCRPYVTET